MYVKNDVTDGVKAALPVILAAAPFGMLFGALAIDNGFTVFEAVLMSATVYAGASQMVGIDLFGDRIAPWLIVLSIFAVNFRHVLYSAVIGRQTRAWSPVQRFAGFFFLIDPQFAEADRDRAADNIPLVHERRDPDLPDVDPRGLDRRRFRKTGVESRSLWRGFPVAGLFSWPRHGVPPAR